jgi:HK97 family phage prohead protease
MLTRLEIIDRLKASPNFPDTDDGEVRAKATILKSPSIDRATRLVKGLVSVAVPDMDSEVVLPMGLDRSYFPDKVKAVYYGHNYHEPPVGACRSMSVKDNGRSLYASTYILPGARGDDLMTAIEAGAINGFSVGFVATEFGPPSPEETKAYGVCETVIRKGRLIEYSITPMPACPDALVEMVSKGAIHRSSAVAFGMPDTPQRKVFPVRGPARVWKVGA